MPDIVPAASQAADALQALSRLLHIMARLRDPVTGCAWDCAQGFATIAPYTIEEAYEVADAIDRGDHGALCEELGDLLLQSVFHARIAEEAGLFDFAAVATGIADKLERRHPHIFGDADANPGWEAIKAAERAAASATPVSALDGVARALPALDRAAKLQRRAAATGFDWPDADGARAKLLEELDEVAAAPDAAARAEEVGDLLFSAVNFARKLGVEPEAALRTANSKFETRFRRIERAEDFAALPLAAKEALWQAAKQEQ